MVIIVSNERWYYILNEEMGRECSIGNTSTPIFGYNIAPREEGKIARERDVAADGGGGERRKKNCITRSAQRVGY